MAQLPMVSVLKNDMQTGSLISAHAKVIEKIELGIILFYSITMGVLDVCGILT